MNGRCRIPKATNARSQTCVHFYDFIQSFHERIHYWSGPERVETVFDFCKCLMPSAMTNINIDDVYALWRGFKKPCAKLATLIGELRQGYIGGHLFGWDKNRNVRHSALSPDSNGDVIVTRQLIRH